MWEKCGLIFFLVKFTHALRTQYWHLHLFHGKDLLFFSLTFNYKAKKKQEDILGYQKRRTFQH